MKWCDGQLLVSILQTAHLRANTGVVFRELSFSRLECGVHDRLHIYPLCGVFYFPWHRHQIEGTNGFYCLIRKTERFTISNVESQVFTPNNSRLPRGLNAGGPRPKRVSYHWTTAPLSDVEHTLKRGPYALYTPEVRRAAKLRLLNFLSLFRDLQ